MDIEDRASKDIAPGICNGGFLIKQVSKNSAQGSIYWGGEKNSRMTTSRIEGGRSFADAVLGKKTTEGRTTGNERDSEASIQQLIIQKDKLEQDLKNVNQFLEKRITGQKRLNGESVR